ncbi:MAG: rhomboid family intramembrane serine protease [Bdellovibrionales bacterium]|nr:rhomboid family intramembrane serine protease [Bdellovibrionales bacterium]
MKRFFKPRAVNIILILNCLVYVAWHLPGVVSTEFMVQNFLVSWTALADGRDWTLLTSVFSHTSFMHFFINMYVFIGFGGFIERILGFRTFIKFYLAAGIFSSLCHALVSYFLLDKPDLPALGASGAISGVIILFALMFPKEKILILGFIPIPALAGALVAVGLDLWGLSAQAGGGGLPIGHGAHLGGALAGAIFYFYMLRRARIRRA